MGIVSAVNATSGTRRCSIPVDPSSPNPSAGSSITIRSLTKHYPGAPRPAVDHVDLDILPGEFIVLLGPSGCGKTTLLKMINRIYEPTSGTVSIDGVDIESMGAPMLRRQIGYVIQQTGLFPHMRIAQNVAVVPKLLKWDQKRIDARVRELLDLVDLPHEDYERRYPTQLSGGEQQRVGLARAIAASPPTMLMDEPFGALDAITRTRLQDELMRIHAHLSQTILFVTHDIEEAIRLADRIVVMDAGAIAQVGTPLEIISEPANQAVADLVGADDVLRRLSLMPARAAISPVDGVVPDGGPTVGADAYLREALSTLVNSGLTQIAVTDESGTPIGILNMDSIQNAASPSRMDE